MRVRFRCDTRWSLHYVTLCAFKENNEWTLSDRVNICSRGSFEKYSFRSADLTGRFYFFFPLIWKPYSVSAVVIRIRTRVKTPGHSKEAIGVARDRGRRRAPWPALSAALSIAAAFTPSPVRALTRHLLSVFPLLRLLSRPRV